MWSRSRGGGPWRLQPIIRSQLSGAGRVPTCLETSSVSASGCEYIHCADLKDMLMRIRCKLVLGVPLKIAAWVNTMTETPLLFTIASAWTIEIEGIWQNLESIRRIGEAECFCLCSTSCSAGEKKKVCMSDQGTLAKVAMSSPLDGFALKHFRILFCQPPVTSRNNMLNLLQTGPLVLAACTTN